MPNGSGRILTEAVEQMSRATVMPLLTHVVAEAARKLSGADGSTFVLREEGLCYYADENAISPLWKGSRFSAQACVSGWCMTNKRVVVIRDIYQDPRVPHDAYRPTFVKSLCMVPIRSADPIGAIGNYWSDGYVPTEEQIALLQALADSAAVAIENLELKGKMQQGRGGDREREFQLALHTIAHDLKSPLSVIAAFIGLLESHLGEVDQQSTEYIKAINDTTTRASQQIQAMLSLYNLQNHMVKKESVDLSGISAELSKEVRALEPKRQVVFKIEPDLRVTADPLLLRMLMQNLISNAFKYTSKKSAAFIHIGRANHNEFFIKDNGDGFDSAKATKLFQPLVRLHDEADFKGTGLGLASVARIVELHGGRVRAEGRKSEGATFFFSLPA